MSTCCICINLLHIQGIHFIISLSLINLAMYISSVFYLCLNVVSLYLLQLTVAQKYNAASSFL
jgi:hypothetical protein